MIVHYFRQKFVENEFVFASFIEALQGLGDQGWLHQRAHVGPKGLKCRARLKHVGHASRQYLFPKNHMTDKSVILLLPEQTPHVAMCEFNFIKSAQDKDVKAGVPEPLELVALFGWHDIAIVSA